MLELFLNTIQDFNDYQGVETLHPLVSVLRVENTDHIRECVMHYGLYVLYLKENKGCRLSYGRTPYDFDEMTVTSFAPGQTVRVAPNPGEPLAKFTALAFHPDLLNRTPLGGGRWAAMSFSTIPARRRCTCRHRRWRCFAACSP